MSAIRTISISANGKAVEPLGGRYFAVISATGGFTVDFGDGVQVPMVAGRRYGPTTFTRLTFTDTSGATNAVQFIASFDEVQVSETTGGTVAATFSAADILSITPAAVTHTCDFEDITGSTAYAGKKAITITNTGAADITVTASGAARTLAPGDSISWSVLRMQDSLPSITVNATGSTARVTWLA